MAGVAKVALTNRMLAASLVGTLAWNWGLAGTLFRATPWSMLGVLLITLFGLLIGSVVGLFRLRAWGYYLTYSLVPFATIVHGIALVPGVTSLMPEGRARSVAVLMVNLGFLIAAVWSHRASED